MCSDIYTTVQFPTLLPLSNILVNGDFNNESGDWQCTRIASIQIFDAVGRRYLADDSVGADYDKEYWHEKLKEYINANCKEFITSDCELSYAYQKVHSGHSP